MRYQVYLLFACLLLALAVSPLAGRAAPAASQNAVAGEVLVKLQPTYRLSPQARATYIGADAAGWSTRASAQQFNRLLARLGATDAEALLPGSTTYRVRLPEQASIGAAVAALAADPLVVFAEPNYIRHLMRMPNDEAVREQWALTNIQAFEAWDITTGGALVVAVLDTGVASSHPDLGDKVLAGFNAVTQNDRTEDDNGHGTAVSGLIAARTNNKKGIAGMCWECKILPVKVLGARGTGNDFSVARGIRWATDAGARIINLSLGGTEDSQVLREAVEYAFNSGALVVSASGNERQLGNAINYPAAYPQVLAVGGTGNTDVVTGFSNTGDHVDLAAPSVGLWTTVLDRESPYGPPNGTSFSSPYVAGTAALVWTLRQDLANTDVKCVLEASADDQGAPGKDPEYGWGRLNAFKAVQLAQSYAGCPLDQPAQPNTPGPVDQTAFDPVPPVPNDANTVYFPETRHTLRGAFKSYWEQNGGLSVFGYPISEEFTQRADDGNDYTVQYFERHRFEYHPQNQPPYHVQLSRLGAVILELQGRSWYAFPKGNPTDGCLFFEETGHTLCEPFLSAWRSDGLEFDGQPGKSFQESLALFGQPLSEPQLEEIAPGVVVPVQWFERARFEQHDGSPPRVLFGLLGRVHAQAVYGRNSLAR